MMLYISTAHCWFIDHDVKFKLDVGIYDNIIDFLNTHNLEFLYNMELDFDKIPFNFHGNGNSTNLLEYLTNNSKDSVLTYQFIHYFSSNIINLKYSSGKKLKYEINMANIWQNMTMRILTPIIFTTTTTTTVPPVITLIGDNPQTINVGDPYVELGATALDGKDGDISSDIVIDATNVDVNTIGSYSVTYNVTDSDGNAADEVVREIAIVESSGVFTMTTTSTNSTWSPRIVTNSGATLHWEVTGAVTTSADANKPTFNFSAPGVKNITITSTDNFIGVTKLSCENINLTNLNITALNSLQHLTCDDNQLTNLDVIGHGNLRELFCYNNSLTALDLTGLVSLEYLICAYNQIASLDATGSSALYELDTENNQLTSLNVSGLSNLMYFYYYNNKLTELDITGLSSLVDSYGDGNNLTSTSINSILDILIAYNNTSGVTLRLNNQTPIAYADPTKVAALDAIWDDVYCDIAPSVITIGTQTWMLKNLDIDDELGGIYAYDDNEANVATYGRLYTWDAAMRVAATVDGWHLPTRTEVQTLLNFAGDGDLVIDGDQDWSVSAGAELLTNGFNLIYSGYKYQPPSNVYESIGQEFYMWSQSLVSGLPYYMIKYYNDMGAGGWEDYPEVAVAIRLIKD